MCTFICCDERIGKLARLKIQYCGPGLEKPRFFTNHFYIPSVDMWHSVKGDTECSQHKDGPRKKENWINCMWLTGYAAPLSTDP